VLEIRARLCQMSEETGTACEAARIITSQSSLVFSSDFRVLRHNAVIMLGLRCTGREILRNRAAGSPRLSSNHD
jgi:hypothetical protein